MDALTPTLQMRRKLTQEIEGQRNQVAVTVSQGREEAGCKQRPLTFLSHTGNCVLNDCMTTWGVLSPNAQKRPFPAGQAEPTRLPFSDVPVHLQGQCRSPELGRVLPGSSHPGFLGLAERQSVESPRTDPQTCGTELLQGWPRVEPSSGLGTLAT